VRAEASSETLEMCAIDRIGHLSCPVARVTADTRV
jgi:hypothetical protein